MGDVFIGQDIRFRKKVKRDLTGVTNARINYTRQDGTTGFWVGTVDGQDIYCDLPASSNTIPGWLETWVSYEKAGKKYIGTKTKKYINT